MSEICLATIIVWWTSDIMNILLQLCKSSVTPTNWEFPKSLDTEWTNYISMPQRKFCDCGVNSYLVPGLLVQVYAAVQWDSLYQLHGQDPVAWQLINHLRDFKKLVSLQQGPVGQMVSVIHSSSAVLEQ